MSAAETAAPANADGAMRLLTISSRPSDYVEMAELARALAARGHMLTLIYFYSASDPGSTEIRREVAALSSDRGVLIGRAVAFEDVRYAASTQPAGVTAAHSRALETSFYRAVLTLRNDILGKDFARKLRRNFPTLTRVLLMGYPLARVADGLANLAGPQLRRELRRVYRELTPADAWKPRVPLSVFLGVPRSLAAASAMIGLYRRFESFFLTTVRDGQFDAILIPEDIVGNLWPVAVKAGHDCAVPTLVFPYTLANRAEALQSLRDEPMYQARNNQLAAALHPRWRLIEDGADLVRLPSPHIFAHEQLGIAPPDPWMMNSGYADAVCVDSNASFEYFSAGGIPPKQLRLVGSASQDQMFMRRQDRASHLAALRRQLALVGDKPLLLVSGCPNQLAAKVPYCEFATIGDVATFVGESLSSLSADYHLVVRPHPNFPEFGTLLAQNGFATTMMPTASLVPLADTFVAFASATIRWAIACGIPTLNYDVFHYGYGDFMSATGVVSVNKKEEFRDAARSLRPGSADHLRLSERIRDDSARWSMMDGQSLTRIEAEIRQAMARCSTATQESSLRSQGPGE